MAPQKSFGDAASELTPAQLGDFLRAEPPAFLDALVRQRMGSVLARQRAELAEQQTEAGRPVSSTASMSGVEACAYAVGFLAYGAQLADGVARLIWRALVG